MTSGASATGCRAGIDIGGTFTDAAIELPHGLRILKVPSTPSSPEQAVDAAFRAAEVDPRSTERFVHGTTIITNLLIERTGKPIAFVTTAGFEDLLEMQAGDKPNTYDLSWTKPDPFVRRSHCLGVHERVDWAGEVVLPLEATEICRVIAELGQLDCAAVAVCLMNAYANGEHERLLAEAIRDELPGVFCCTSTDVDPAIHEHDRASTTVLNAYAMPAVSAYIGSRRPDWGVVEFMSSRGGAVDAEVAAELPISLAFSGPAGGVVGAAALSYAAGYGDLLTFDMGGTSTDVAIVRKGATAVSRSADVVWGIPSRAPSLEIRSVGAGGGSILQVDTGGALRVGPMSAGVEPGPACYGRGGRLAAITDVNLVLGFLPGDTLGYGTIALDREAAYEALRQVAGELGATPEEVADGAYRIVNAAMAQAVRETTVYRGIDPREFTLFAFGSAAAQHAVEVAREMRVSRVILPAAASVFSAVGMLSARLERHRSRPLNCLVDDLVPNSTTLAALTSLETALRQASDGDLSAPPIWTLECRHAGQIHTLDIAYTPEVDTPETVRERFLAEHDRLFGVRGNAAVEVVSASLTLATPVRDFAAWWPSEGMESAGHLPEAQLVLPEGRTVDVLRRESLEQGASGAGPVLVADASSTAYVPSGASWLIDKFGSLVIDTGVAG